MKACTVKNMENLDLSNPSDREQLQKLLIASVTMLCRKAVNFHNKVSVEGLLGITVDDETVLLVNVNELLQKSDLDEQGNDIVLKPDPATDLYIRSSSSRRKSKVTRKAVFNLENEQSNISSDLNADWNVESNDDDMCEGNGDRPLNLVKCEVSDFSEAPRASNGVVAVSELQGTQDDAATEHDEVYLENDDSLTSDNVSTVNTSSGLNHSWPLPSMQQSNIRKYGSYGYIINQGNDVIFSCNQCPKIFRNRVSLWRHGVKHKMMQGGGPSKGTTSTTNSIRPKQNNIAQKHAVSDESSQLVIMQTNLMNYQNKLGIKSTPVSSYGVLSHYGKKTWYTCIVCQDKFLTRASLWRHKSRHAALTNLEQKHRSNANEAVVFTMTTEGNDSNASTCQDLVAEAASEDVEMNGEIIKSDSNSSPSMSEQHVNFDQNYNIPLTDDVTKEKISVTMATNLRSSIEQSVNHSNIPAQYKDGIAKGNSKATSIIRQLPAGVLPSDVGNHENVRLIGRYGYVVTTAEGKLYNCIDCSKSFRNRVSLWKHQAKHQ